MKRRKVLAGLVTLPAAALMSSCSSKGGSGGSGSKSVDMWVYPILPNDTGQPFWDGVAKDFESKNAGITVKVTQFPWADRDQKLATAIAAGKQPDVVYLIPDQLSVYAKSIVPVTDFLPQSEIANYHKSAITSVTYQDKALGVPTLLTVLPTICNKKLFDSSGLSSYPKTWDDLLSAAPALKSHSFYATEIDADTQMTLNNSWYIHLWQAGGMVYAPDGKSVAFNSPAGLAALQFEKKLVDGGFVPKQELTKIPPAGQGASAKGQVACLFNSPVTTQLEQYWGKNNVVVLPPLTDGTNPEKTYGTVGSFSMLKGADQDAAGKWIQYITSPPVMTKLLKQANYFSPRTDVGPLYADDPLLGAEEKILNQTAITAGPLQPTARQIMGVLGPEIQGALLGKKDPQQALDDAAKAANSLIQSAQ